MIEALAFIIGTRQQIAFEATPDVRAQVGVVHFVNRHTGGLDDETAVTIETPRGPVTAILHTTPNNACNAGACPDWLEIVGTPEGTVAVPGALEVPEGGAGAVLIVDWSGM